MALIDGPRRAGGAGDPARPRPKRGIARGGLRLVDIEELKILLDGLKLSLKLRDARELRLDDRQSIAEGPDDRSTGMRLLLACQAKIPSTTRAGSTPLKRSFRPL